MKYDFLIVGAGYTGAVIAERIASQLDRKVLIIDRRPHIAGNAYDEYDEHGVLIHRYGAHIFHTNSDVVWRYLSKFTDWVPYQHRVLAEIDGHRVPVPFNLNSLHALFPRSEAEYLEKLLIQQYGVDAKVPILKLRESVESGLHVLADFIYEKVFYGYTLKQWGFTPEQLGPSVTGRVPISVNRDDRYFQDIYQAMPAAGYTALFKALLDHPNIEVRLGVSFKEIETSALFDEIVFTGPIDEFFNASEGALPYRSLRFDIKHHSDDFFQEAGAVNFPNSHSYTRILEFKRLTGQTVGGTTVATEYPEDYCPGRNEPYYPVPMDENRLLYGRYADKAKKLNGRVLFAGRLGDYKYYNMDQAAARALQVFERDIASL